MKNSILLVAALSVLAMSISVFFVLWKGQSRKHTPWKNGAIPEDGALNAKLIKSGVSDTITVFRYRVIQMILFLVGIVFGIISRQSMGITLASGIMAALFPEFWLKQMVKRENRKMLPDIEHIYNLLHLQSHAGAFFFDSLVDCYLVVSHKRLKNALINLVAEINGRQDVRAATERFAEKFDNPYLTTLAGIINHGVEHGNTDTMLSDVVEQIQNIQNAMYIEEEGRQELQSMLLFTMLFLGILAGMLYLGLAALQSTTNSIWM